MARRTLIIDSVLGGTSETQYNGSKGSYNVGLGIDPDFALSDPDNSGAITAGVRASGFIMPTRYEKFTSSLIAGNVKWIISNPKNTLIYSYTNNPSGSAIELNSLPFISDATLQGYYRMTSGAVETDSSANGKTLTNVGTVTTGTGKFGDAADFGTANSTKGLRYSTDRMGYIGGAYSMSFWIKMRTEIAAGTVRIIKIADTTSTLSQLQVFYDYNAGTRRLVFNRLRMNVANDDGYINTTLGTSSWHHVVITYNGTTKTGYLDGVLGTQGTSSGNGNLATGYTDGLGISDDLNLNAYIDDVALFNKELSQTEVLQMYTDGGNFVSHTSALSGETLVASPTSGQTNGLAYYNNYIYVATNTDIGRYGPLNATPSYTSSVWTAATLGSQPALINTTYPTVGGVSIPNHPMHVHGDNKCYVADYNTTSNPGKGVIHYIATTKTTYEGDTDNTSTNDKLALPFGFLPTDIESYGVDLAISAIQSTDSTTNQGSAALFFWDTTSSTFYRGPIYSQDPLITAMKSVNGELYVWSGNSTRGCRLSKYIGGDSLQEIMFIEDSPPPLAGAIESWGSRIAWGGSTSYPSGAGVVYSYGSKDKRLGKSLMIPIVSTAGSTTPLVTSILNYSHLSFVRPKLIVGWGNGTTYGIDKLSTTATYTSVWRSELFSIGRKFKIERIRIPLAAAVASNMSIVPKIWLDDMSSSVTLGTISTTLYSGDRKIVYHGIELESALGEDNFLLELTFGGTAELPVGLPIEIDIDTYEDESN